MRLDPDVALSPSSMVPAEAFTTDDHTEAEYVYYQSEDATTIWRLEVRTMPRRRALACGRTNDHHFRGRQRHLQKQWLD